MPINLGILSQHRPAANLQVFLQSSNGAFGSAGTIGIPSVRYGDFIILFQYADGFFSDPTDVSIADLTDLINNTDGGTVRSKVSVKIADGNETSYTGITDGVGQHRTLAVFRGKRPFRSYEVSAINQECTNGNPALQTVSAGNITGPVIVFAFYASNGTIDPRTLSVTEDAEINSGETHCYMKFRIYNDVGEDVTVDMDDEGAENFLGSFYVKLST